VATTRKVEVAIVGDASSMVRAFRTADGAASGFGRGGSRLMAAGLGMVAGASAVATAAIGRGLANAVRTGVDEFQQQAAVSAQTAAALKSTGNAAGVTKSHIEGMASSLQAQTGAQDDAVQSAENLLLTFTSITNKGPDKTFDRATRATLDLSTAFHKDLNGSAIMVGKALNDPVKGITALGRAGVQFTADQKETIKTLVETGRKAEAQKLILGELEHQVKGSAAAFGQTTPGQIQRAQRAYEDLTQGLVGAVAPAFAKLLPVVTKAITGLAPMLQKLASTVADLATQLVNSPEFQQFATTLRDIAVRGVQVLSDGLRVLAPIVLGVVAPIAALTSGLLNSSVAMTALLAGFAAFAAIRVADKVTEITTALRTMAVTATATGPVAQLGRSLSLLTTGFSGVSAKAVGLAPGLTAAGAGISRVATAGRMAGSAMTSMGGAAMAAVGGPWVVGIAAAAATVTTLATVIGTDLVASFMGAGSAVDQYRDALNNAQTAQANLVGAQGTMEQSMLTFIQATKDEAAARRDAAAAGGHDADSNRRLAAAIAATDAARGPAVASMGNYVQKLRDGQKAIGDMTGKLTGATASLGVYAGMGRAASQSTEAGREAWAKYDRAVDAVKRRVASSPEFQQQQQALTRLGDYLGTLGPKYAGVATEAAKVAKMKPGEAQQAAVDALMGKLDKLNAKVTGTQPTIKMKGADRAQSDIQAVKDKLAELNGTTATVTIKTVRTDSGGGGGKGQNVQGQGSTEPSVTTWRDLGKSMQQTFMSLRQGIASAVSGLGNMIGQARRAMYAGQGSFSQTGQSLNAQQSALAKRQSERQEAQLIANRDRLRDDANATDADRKAAQDELDDYYAQKEIDRTQAAVDAQAAADEKAVTSLANRFKRGEIDAATFQTELATYIGGDTGATLGTMFGDEWASALLEALAPMKSAIWTALGLDTLAGGDLDPTGLAGAKEQDNAPHNEWRKNRGNFIRALNAAKGKDGKLSDEEKKNLRSQYHAITLAEWERENPEPRKFATGGVVTAATLGMIGEAGPEAVIPLSSPRARQLLAGAGSAGMPVLNLTFNGVLDAKDAARVLRPELDRLVRLAV